MNKIINALGVLCGGLSILLVLATVASLIATILDPSIMPLDDSEPLILVMLTAFLLLLSAIAFSLSSIGSNLMLMATSEDKVKGILRIGVILFLTPILMEILLLPFLLVVAFSFLYGQLAGVIGRMVLEGLDIETLSSLVSFFLLGEALHAAYRFNLFDWYLSPKKDSSLNLAESQFQEIYAKVDGIWRSAAHLVRISIRATALNLIVILLWAGIKFSGVMAAGLNLANLPTIAIAVLFGLIPIAVMRSVKIKFR